MSVVVFVNPHSRASRRRPVLADDLARLVEGVGQVLAPPSLEALADDARRLAARPPQVIAIHGGDGTLHHTVTALVRAFADKPLPPLAVLAGGTMNVVASSLGIRVPTVELVAELVDGVREGKPHATLRRRCMRIGESYGFVFGNGFMANFLEEYYAPGRYGPSRAVWLLARTFLSGMVGGGYARRMFRKFEGRVWVDGQPLPWQALTGIGAATVREVGMGFKLNHRADEDPDRFSVLAIHAGPLALAADLYPVHRGLGIAPERAWSAVASSLRIESGGDFSYTVDGDLYRAAGTLEVAAGPDLTLIRPRRARALAVR